MSESFTQLQRTWEKLGEEDPLWAILSDPGKEGGRWELSDFLETGNIVVNEYRELLLAHGAPGQWPDVLDFGCGIGRLTLAWSKYSQLATGVDISAPMIARGQQLAEDNPAVRLVLNLEPNLALFRDNSFDLVFSHICLQHIPWKHARLYLLEFARVCKPGGFLAFQLPSGTLKSQTPARIRRWLVDHLPFGWGAAYRRWRTGRSECFNMHFTSSQTVKTVLESAGMKEIHRESDKSAGPGTTGFRYLYQKPGSPTSSGG